MPQFLSENQVMASFRQLDQASVDSGTDKEAGEEGAEAPIACRTCCVQNSSLLCRSLETLT